MNEKVIKPWGGEYIFARYPDLYVGKIIFIRKGESLSKQYHETKHETMVVVNGKAKIELEMGEIIVSADVSSHKFSDPIEISPDEVHRVTALEDTLIFEVSTDHLDDVVRLEDKYGRVEDETSN